MSGGPLDLNRVKHNNKVQSILWVGYPGQSGGDAIAQIIYGVHSPAGRLPHTVYLENYVNQISMEDMNMRPSKNSPGRTYRFFTGTPVYEFGHGLSYTNFTVHPVKSQESISISKDFVQSKYEIDEDYAVVNFTYNITNVGKVTSDFVFHLYEIGPNPGKNGNPLRSLVFFDRLHNIKPGHSDIVHVSIRASAFSNNFNNEGKIEFGGKHTFIVKDFPLLKTNVTLK